MPSVVLVTERFTTLAKASMRGNGVPDAPMVVLPKTELTEYVEPDVVRTVAKEAVELIITIIGIFVLFYWAVQPGTHGSNKYGLDPLLPYAEPDFPDFEEASGTFGSQGRPGFCAACGTVSEPDANFCRSCGAAV